MSQQFKNRQHPAGNPLANILVVIVGAIVIGVSFVLGIVALIALASALVVLAAVIGVRLWWLNRRIRRQRGHSAKTSSPSATNSAVIEGEYRVVDAGKDSKPSD
jgi:protein-S-isoprenylcysteine O-methyltransferase Ste14